MDTPPSVDEASMDAVDEPSTNEMDASIPDVLGDECSQAGSCAEAAACAFPPTCPLAAGCPDVPRMCPAPPPSYAQEVGRILTNDCTPCHHTGSTIAPGDFTTYTQFRNYKPGTAYQLVVGCAMPPPDAGSPMPADDRATFIDWCACGYPNN